MSPQSGTDSDNKALSVLLDRSMPADSEVIADAVDAISETLTRLGVPEPKRLEVGLAVQEALANAVVHGCGGDSSKNVRCQLKTDAGGRILIIVTDPGPGFSANQISDPQRRENLHADHGRGVYLIRQLMDEVHFEGNGNEIRMWKY